MFTLAFWKAAAERAVKSAAQGVIVFWAVGDGMLNLWSIDPKETAGVAGGMLVLSLVMSLASAPFGNGGPSLSTEKVES